MLNLTDEQKAMFKETGHFPGYIFTFSDIDLTITNETINDQAVTVKESIMDTNELTLGGCIASSIEFEVSEIIANQISGQEFTAHIEVTDAENIVELENLPMGTFVNTTAQMVDNKDYKKITAYDKLSLATVDVSDWYNTFFKNNANGYSLGHTVKETRESLLDYLGIPYVEQNLKNDDYICEKTVDGGNIIGIDLLKMLCSINGGFGKMNRDGRFEIVFLNPLDDETDEAVIYDAQVFGVLSGYANTVKFIECSDLPDDYPKKIMFANAGGKKAYYNYSDDGTFTFISDAERIKIRKTQTTKWEKGITRPWTAQNLIRLDISMLDLSEFDRLSFIFPFCENLKTLVLTGSNLTNITCLDNAFEKMGMKVIDLSGVELSDVISAKEAFLDCENLETIYANNDTLNYLEKDSTTVFANCPELVGENGTICDGEMDASYARIDKDDSPGLFTYKESREKSYKTTCDDYRSLKYEEHISNKVSCITIKGNSSEDVGITVGYDDSNPYIMNGNVFLFNAKANRKNLCDYSVLTWMYINNGTHYIDNENFGVHVTTKKDMSGGLGGSGTALADFHNESLNTYTKYTDGNYVLSLDVTLDGLKGESKKIKIGFENDLKTISISGGEYKHFTFPITGKDYFYAVSESDESFDFIVANIMILHKDEEDKVTFERYNIPIVDIANNIFNRIKNISYRPMTASVDGLPYKEVGDAFVIKKDFESDDTEENIVRSYIFSRTMAGVASLVDTYEAKGVQERKNEITLVDETYRTAGTEFKFFYGSDGLTAQMTNFETKVETQFGVYDGQIVMKVDDDGNMALCELTTDPEDGTAFNVKADNINMEAWNLDLTAHNMKITSDNFNVTEKGEVTASALAITGGGFNIDSPTGESVIYFKSPINDGNVVVSYGGEIREPDFISESEPMNTVGEDGNIWLQLNTSQKSTVVWVKDDGEWIKTSGSIFGTLNGIIFKEVKINTNDGMSTRGYSYLTNRDYETIERSTSVQENGIDFKNNYYSELDNKHHEGSSSVNYNHYEREYVSETTQGTVQEFWNELDFSEIINVPGIHFGHDDDGSTPYYIISKEIDGREFIHVGPNIYVGGTRGIVSAYKIQSRYDAEIAHDLILGGYRQQFGKITLEYVAQSSAPPFPNYFDLEISEISYDRPITISVVETEIVGAYVKGVTPIENGFRVLTENITGNSGSVTYAYSYWVNETE